MLNRFVAFATISLAVGILSIQTPSGALEEPAKLESQQEEENQNPESNPSQSPQESVDLSVPDTEQHYQEPKDSSGEISAKMSGTRGEECEQLPDDVQTTLLVPDGGKTPYTISERPTLLFHLSKKSSVPIKVILSAPGRRTPLYIAQLNPAPGFVTVTPPPSTPPLEVGKEYVWTVVLLCAPNELALNPYARAPFKRVALAAPSPPDPAQKVVWLAQNGIWHEAIALAYQLRQDNPNTRKYQRLFWQLIEEANLTESFRATAFANN